MESSIFSKGKDLHEDVQVKVDTHTRALLSVVERQKSLENVIETLQDKVEIIDRGTIETFKKIFDEIKDIHTQILHIREDVTELQEFNKKLRGQLKLFTSKDEVTKIEKYVDMWEPMNFITREEAKKMTEDIKQSLIKKLEEHL